MRISHPGEYIKSSFFICNPFLLIFQTHSYLNKLKQLLATQITSHTTHTPHTHKTRQQGLTTHQPTKPYNKMACYFQPSYDEDMSLENQLALAQFVAGGQVVQPTGYIDPTMGNLVGSYQTPPSPQFAALPQAVIQQQQQSVLPQAVGQQQQQQQPAQQTGTGKAIGGRVRRIRWKEMGTTQDDVLQEWKTERGPQKACYGKPLEAASKEATLGSRSGRTKEEQAARRRVQKAKSQLRQREKQAAGTLALYGKLGLKKPKAPKQTAEQTAPQEAVPVPEAVPQQEAAPQMAAPQMAAPQQMVAPQMAFVWRQVPLSLDEALKVVMEMTQAEFDLFMIFYAQQDLTKVEARQLIYT